MPLLGVQLPSLAMTMTDRNISEKPSEDVLVKEAVAFAAAVVLTINRAKPTNETERVAVADQEGQRIPRAR